MDERRRCAAAKRERTARGLEKMARRRAVHEAERAVRAERGARFQATHKRLREEPGPRGTEPLVAHAGGVITTNKEEALSKFVARMNRAADERAKEGGDRQERREEGADRAKRARAAAQAIAMLEERKRKREAEVQREEEDKRAHRMLRRNSRAWKMENGDGATENAACAAAGSRSGKAAALVPPKAKKRRFKKRGGANKAGQNRRKRGKEPPG